jgi:hypothetical protein
MDRKTSSQSKIVWSDLDNYWSTQYEIDYQIPVSEYKNPNIPY